MLPKECEYCALAFVDDNDIFVYTAATSKDVSSLISLRMYKVDELILEKLHMRVVFVYTYRGMWNTFSMSSEEIFCYELGEGPTQIEILLRRKCIGVRV